MMKRIRTISPWAIFGFGVILVLLLSLPVIAIATGALEDTPTFTLMKDVPAEGDGAYLQVNDGKLAGVVQLYPWNFELNEFPLDAPVFNPAHVQAVVFRQPGMDDATRYHVFRFDDGDEIEMPMNAQWSPTKLILTPQAPLIEGQYVIDMPKSGLSSDRQYLYFVLQEKVTTLPVKGAMGE
jgi:hypothetical protein